MGAKPSSLREGQEEVGPAQVPEELLRAVCKAWLISALLVDRASRGLGSLSGQLT